MDPERWELVESIFAAALQRPTEQRADFLREAVGGDSELGRLIGEMLAAHAADDGGLVDTPMVTVRDLDVELANEPQRIGPFTLVRLLGRGGMGEVYLATHEGEGFSRNVALKVIRRGMDTDEVLRRFTNERRILASLKHPHIARLIDGGATDDGRPYFVMEYVEGRPIDEYCRALELTVERRLHLFRSVCDAVQHAHQNLVVHRDLKPSNILVTADGLPKLLDFGIGKLIDVDDDVSATRTGVRVLTPEYASPEQVAGAPITAASDVYGLGVLLYELLTGSKPHSADSGSDELESAVLRETAARPSSRVPTRMARRLRGDLDVIVMKALRKEPDRRYPSVSAFADDVRRHLEGLPIRARPDTFGYRAGKFIRRNRISVAAAAVVFVALTGATAYSVDQSRRVVAERDKALEVHDFLLEMFGAADPDGTGDVVTARQLLDGQAEALQTTYQDQPVLRAQMMYTLAEGYDRLGLFSEAERLVRRSLDLRREALGEEHEDVASAIGLLGWVLHEAGDSEQGEALLRQAIPIWRELGNRPAGLSRALNDLGVIMDANGEYDAAAELYAEALELRRVHFGEEHRRFAVTASNLSVIHYRRADYAKAATVALEALGAMRASVGADHQRSILIQNNIAAFSLAQGDLSGAETQYVDLLERQTRLQGPEHPLTLRVMGALGSVYLRQRRWVEAEEIMSAVVEINERRLGPDHREVAAGITRLAQALSGQQRSEDALPLLLRALDIYRTSYGPVHTRVADTNLTIGETYDRMGQRDLADEYVARAADVIEQALGADHPRTAEIKTRHAVRLLRNGDADGAAALYASALPVFEARLDPGHVRTHQTRLRLAHSHLAAGRVAIADSLLRTALEGFEVGGATENQRELADSLQGALTSTGAR